MTRDQRRLPTRKDAVANRERLLAGAEAYFADLGIDAPLHGLADRVGVGIGTLYRNFPNHADLVRAMYDRVIDRFESTAELCMQQASGWDSLVTMIRTTVQDLVERPATAAVIRRQTQNDPDHRPVAKWETPIRAFLRLAQDEGAVRLDVTVEHVLAIPFALSSVSVFPPAQRRELADSLVTVMLDGLRPVAGAGPVDGTGSIDGTGRGEFALAGGDPR